MVLLWLSPDTVVRFYDLYCFPELNEPFVFAQVQFDFSVDNLIVPNNHQGWVIHDVYRS